MASWQAMRLQIYELLALLCLLAVRCSAIDCHCSTTAPFSHNVFCRHNGNTCTTSLRCFARRRYSAESDSIYTDWDCFDSVLYDETSVETFCNGSRNSATIAYQCCDDANRCNQDLDVRLPRETASSSALASISPTSTSAPLLQPTSTVPSATPMPTATATDGPTQQLPPTGRLTCYCNASSPLLVPPHCTENGYSCQTDHTCYVQHFNHDDGLMYTRWDCYDPIVSVSVGGVDLFCSGRLNSNTLATVCCNDSNRCNRFLEVPEVIPSEVPTDETPSPSVSLETDTDSDDLFLWLTIAVLVMLVLVVIATGIICIVVVVHFNRLTRKLKSDKILFKR